MSKSKTHTQCGVKLACKECGTRSKELGAIYCQGSNKPYYHNKLDYFVCQACFDYTVHVHTFSKTRSAPTHLHGDISGHDIEWLASCRALTTNGIYPPYPSGVRSIHCAEPKPTEPKLEVGADVVVSMSGMEHRCHVLALHGQHMWVEGPAGAPLTLSTDRVTKVLS